MHTSNMKCSLQFWHELKLKIVLLMYICKHQFTLPIIGFHYPVRNNSRKESSRKRPCPILDKVKHIATWMNLILTFILNVCVNAQKWRQWI